MSDEHVEIVRLLEIDDILAGGPRAALEAVGLSE